MIGLIIYNCFSFSDSFTFKSLFTSISMYHRSFQVAYGMLKIVGDSNTIGISKRMEKRKNIITL